MSCVFFSWLVCLSTLIACAFAALIFDVFFVILAFLFCCLSVLLRPIRSDGGTRLWWVCLRVNTDYRHWVFDLRSPPVSG